LSSRIVVESAAAVRRLRDSPEFRAAREARAGMAVFDMLLAEGLQSTI
jgi:uncharacterized protein (DUF1330 family)